MHLLCQGNALRLPLADQSVHCVVTSPPYWGLRDYGVPGQLGLEPTPDEYIAKMVQVFREVWRVLRDDGTCWVNIGDSYAQSGPPGGIGKQATNVGSTGIVNRIAPPGLKPKDLVGIPWRLAFALQADGWYLRSDIIWAKPNPMPESVTDRPTKSHEYLFLLSKSEKYFFDADAVREPQCESSFERARYDRSTEKTNKGRPTGKDRDDNGRERASGLNALPYTFHPSGRNIRSVWTISTEAYPGSHFATFPRKLVEPCIKAGTSEKGCCPECGKPWERVVESERVATRPARQSKINGHSSDEIGNRDPRRHVAVKTDRGWNPGCHCRDPIDDCLLPPVSCVVFDPFIGSGTTIVVANALGRHGIGLDLSTEYLKLASQRITRPHAAIQRPGREESHPLFDRNA